MRKYRNRRKYLRIPMVNIIRAKLDDGSIQPVVLVDLSSGGAKILTNFPIHMGMRINLTIPLMGEEVIEKKGKVVWVKEMEFMRQYKFGIECMAGIEFDSVSEEIKKFIDQFFKKNS